MRRGYFSQWFTAVRVLLFGVFAAVVFFWRPWESMAPVSTAQILVALIGAIAGVRLGFLLTAMPAARTALFRVSPVYYQFAGGMGFIFGALWAYDSNGVWPFVVWFLPAAILEAISSGISLLEIQSAS